MPQVTRIEIPMENFDPRLVEEKITKYCINQYGYSPLGDCSCSDLTFGVEKRKFIENNGRTVKGKVETEYTECIRCLHFGNGGEGLAFVIESYETESGIKPIPNNSSPTIIFRDNLPENQPKKYLNSVKCYAYGDRFRGNGELMNFECGVNRAWSGKLATPPILKEMNLDIGDDILIADGLYESMTPEMLNSYEGCFEPKDLSRHLANLDVASFIGVLLNRDVNEKEENAIEETVFGYTGYPSCWEDNPKLRFVSKRPVEHDVDDEGIPEDGDIDKFIEYLKTITPRNNSRRN